MNSSAIMEQRLTSLMSLEASLLLGQDYAVTTTRFLLLMATSVIVYILKLISDILEPNNYELDMTTKEFCIPLAEVDNGLTVRRPNGLDTGPSSPRSDTDDWAVIKQGNSTHGDSLTDHEQAGRSTSDDVYPNGWIPVMESSKIAPGCVERGVLFGRDIIITRSADGQQVSVLDAYCPHMGVNIGINSTTTEVDGQSCVECPFHGWTFRASDGQCVRIPYQKKVCIPKQAKLGRWETLEVDNFVYVWHHIDNSPPTWSLEPSQQLKAGRWQLIGRSCHKTNMELRDMLENGADMNHFEAIHNDLFMLGSKITKLQPLNYLQEYTRHHWLPEWKPIVDELGKMTHVAQMKLQSWISLWNLRLFDITVHAYQIGPARVKLYYDSKWYGKGLLIMNSIPLGGRRTKYIQHIYTERTLFQCFMAKWVLYGEIKMLERDFFIWNHKKNIKNPVLVPEDKTLKQFRMWHSRFYKRTRKITIGNSENLDGNGEPSTKLCDDLIDF